MRDSGTNVVLLTSEPVDTGALIARARAGDSEAFGDLCRSLAPSLLRHAAALCGDRTLAEDLTQDTFVEAWKCLARYNGRCQFFTWLCAILLHRHLNLLRRQRPFPFSLLTPEREPCETGAERWPDSSPGPDQVAEARERELLVQRCLGALPRKHREVIYLRFYVDQSLEGIAVALGCSVGTVKSRLFHALEKLRKMTEFRKGFAQFEKETESL